MAAYVNIPSETDLAPLERIAASAARVADAEYARVTDAVKRLADPRSKEARNLTAKEAFDEQQRLRSEGAANIAAATGDIAAHRETLGRFVEGLDLHTIASNAEFLPIMGSGADSTAHDMRIIASHTRRSEYRDRLARVKPADIPTEAKRIVRDAGEHPDRTPELAKLHELDQHVRTLPSGPETVAAKSALIGAWGAVEAQWTTRTDLLDRVQRVAWNSDKADDLARALRQNREPATVTKARDIAQAMIAAGKAA